MPITKRKYIKLTSGILGDGENEGSNAGFEVALESVVFEFKNGVDVCAEVGEGLGISVGATVADDELGRWVVELLGEDEGLIIGVGLGLGCVVWPG